MQPNNPYAPTPQPDYDFIMNHGQQPQKSMFPGSGSKIGRILIIGVGLVVLLIIFSVVRGLLTGKSSMPEIIGVAQDQASIIHLASNAIEQENISEQNLNFALTTQLSVKSSQTNTLNYLSKNKVKVKPKVLVLKTSTKTDQDLATAATNSNYNEVFHDTMKTQLETYQRDLQSAYQHTKGPNGKALLSKNFDAAELLLTQLDSR
jgi:hypothetical protein